MKLKANKRVVNLILNGLCSLQEILESLLDLVYLSRKPYSKWTMFSTIIDGYYISYDFGRKPYSKWTMFSTKVGN